MYSKILPELEAIICRRLTARRISICCPNSIKPFRLPSILIIARTHDFFRTICRWRGEAAETDDPWSKNFYQRMCLYIDSATRAHYRDFHSCMSPRVRCHGRFRQTGNVASAPWCGLQGVAWSCLVLEPTLVLYSYYTPKREPHIRSWRYPGFVDFTVWKPASLDPHGRNISGLIFRKVYHWHPDQHSVKMEKRLTTPLRKILPLFCKLWPFSHPGANFLQNPWSVLHAAKMEHRKKS